MERNASIAILFFSRSAEIEASSKKWTGDLTRDRAIARSLRTQAMSSIQNANLPFYTYSEKEQIGNSFSERLQYAFADVFSKGHSHVIALGSDLPSISQLDWDTICDRLLNQGTLLGPDARGGVYLLGLDRPSFEQAAFESLPWQSHGLFKGLISLFPNSALLEERQDMNNINDLQDVLKSGLKLVRSLIAILSIQWCFTWEAEEHHGSVFLTTCSKRGPPKVLVA